MRSPYYSALARAKLIANSKRLESLRRGVGRMPLARSAAPAAKRWVQDALLPRRLSWVQVESGFAQGLWLRLNLRVEGGYWIGRYESALQDELEAWCEAGSIFYDVGASLGFFSLAVARRVGPQGRVFAFEPEPENWARLRQMSLRNGLADRIELVKAAAWSRTARLPFRRGGAETTYGGVAADGATPPLATGETQVVEGISLDDFVRRGHPGPDVVKIDVEGGECEVLRGADQLLARKRPTLVCEVHREEAARWIKEWLRAKEYSTLWSIPPELWPRLLRARPREGNARVATTRP